MQENPWFYFSTGQTGKEFSGIQKISM